MSLSLLKGHLGEGWENMHDTGALQKSPDGVRQNHGWANWWHEVLWDWLSSLGNFPEALKYCQDKGGFSILGVHALVIDSSIWVWNLHLWPHLRYREMQELALRGEVTALKESQGVSIYRHNCIPEFFSLKHKYSPLRSQTPSHKIHETTRESDLAWLPLRYFTWTVLPLAEETGLGLGDLRSGHCGGEQETGATHWLGQVSCVFVLMRTEMWPLSVAPGNSF